MRVKRPWFRNAKDGTAGDAVALEPSSTPQPLEIRAGVQAGAQMCGVASSARERHIRLFAGRFPPPVEAQMAEETKTKAPRCVWPTFATQIQTQLWVSELDGSWRLAVSSF